MPHAQTALPLATSPTARIPSLGWPGANQENRILLLAEECDGAGNLRRLISRLKGSVSVTEQRLSILESAPDEALDALLQDHDICILYAPTRGLNLLNRLVGLDTTAGANAAGRPPMIVVGRTLDSGLDDEALKHGAADFLVLDDLNAEMLDRSIRYSLERHRAASELGRLAMFDPLTGLYNRSMFHELLRNAVLRARRSDKRVTLIYLDLDRFKNVNDTLGHQAGDDLLVQAAQRMREHLRESDPVCRLGGDEFTIVLEGTRSSTDSAIVARKILDCLSEAFTLQGKQVFVSASIGIAEFPDSAGDVETLIGNADLAMYRAKNQGRGCYQFFTSEFSKAARRRAAIEDLIREALSRGGFELLYQPQLELASGKIIGLEALIRMNDRAFGRLMPNEFIPIAEDSGLIGQVGDWVMLEACRQGASWRDMGLDGLRVSVNVSARQFQHRDVITSVARALDMSGLSADLLDLELTENHLANDPDATGAILNRLNSLGVGLSIDDFGTGYSSLSTLKRSPVSWLKIDRSFVAGLPSKADDIAIVEAVIGLAHSLGIRAIAEGVETDAQLEMLEQAGCDAIQGYLIAEPLRPDEIPAWVARHKTTHQKISVQNA